MTRIAVAVGILFGFFVSHSLPVQAQTDGDCFPWQELRDGRCVPKGSGMGLAAPAQKPVTSSPCTGGTSDANGQCVCPARTHLDEPNGSCVADVIPPVPALPPPAATPRARVTLVCEGGTPSDGRCDCPAGFTLKPAPDDPVGGTCVRTDAESCQGGELTTSGVCLCDRRVVMSGEEYALEYVNGKCLPQRCPVTGMQDGKCPPVPVRAGEPTEKTRPPSPKLVEDGDHPRHCGRGMIHTRNGCVPARRRYPGIYGDPAGVSGYYRSQVPGYLNTLPQN